MFFTGKEHDAIPLRIGYLEAPNASPKSATQKRTAGPKKHDRINIMQNCPLSSGLIRRFSHLRPALDAPRGPALSCQRDCKEARNSILWSCIFFSTISSGFGMALSGLVLSGTDFIRMFGAVFWSAITRA